MLDRNRRSPRLLISVRHVSELPAALAGADLIDVKEPTRGPLGMSDLPVISAIADAVSVEAPGAALSVALGELIDWPERRSQIALPAGVDYVKVGLSRTHDHPDWHENWIRLRERVVSAGPKPLKWIAVAYADARIAGSPPLSAVVDAAIKFGCAGLLVDTYSKTAGSLRELVSDRDLEMLSERTQEASLLLGLAGRVTLADLPLLCGLPSAIVGVRSAVCVSADRRNPIGFEQVIRFRREFDRAIQHSLVTRI